MFRNIFYFFSFEKKTIFVGDHHKAAIADLWWPPQQLVKISASSRVFSPSLREPLGKKHIQKNFFFSGRTTKGGGIKNL